MKTLKQLLEFKKPAPTEPFNKASETSLDPKSFDEKRFKDKHVVKVKPEVAGNGDDVFKASNVKAYDRKASRHGNNTGDDIKVYEEVGVKTIKQILGEKHLTPNELKARERIAKGIEKSDPGIDMGKKMAIATAKAKQVAESLEEFNEQYEQLDEAARHDQYVTYNSGVKDMLKKLAVHVDAHKEAAMSPTEWNKEKGANMNSGHVYTMKNLHRQLQDMCDNCQQDVEYAKPYKAPKVTKEEVEQPSFDMFEESIRSQIQTVYESLDEDNKQTVIEMIESGDYETVVDIVTEVLNA
jgi:hypothetical protein